MLTDRELASLILLAFFTGFACLRINLPTRFLDLLKALWGRLLLAWCGYVGYLVLIIALAERTGLWNLELLKGTIIWISLAGVALFASFARMGKEPGCVRRRILQMLSVTAFLEFFMNLTTFSLIWELVLQVLLTVLALMIVATKGDELKLARQVLQGTYLAIIGAWLIATVVVLSETWQSLDPTNVLRSLALGFWLPLAALPAVWVLSLLAAYEKVFACVTFRVSSRRTQWTMRLALLTALTFRLRLVWSFSGQWIRLMSNTRSYRQSRRIGVCFREAHRGSTQQHLAVRTAALRSMTSTIPASGNAPEGIPGCEPDMTNVIRTKPPGWQFLLFAGLLNTLRMTVDRQYDLRAMGIMPKTQAVAHGKELAHLIRRHDLAQGVAADLDRTLASDLQERAFDGDVDALISLAHEIISAYERFRAFRVADRTTFMHSDFARASQLLDDFARQPTHEITRFVATVTHFAADLPRRLSAGETVEVAFTLTLTVPDKLLDDYHSALEAGTASRLAA